MSITEKLIAKTTLVFYDNEPPYYQGYVACVHNGRTLWKEWSKIDRLTEADAKADAEQMVKQYLSLFA